MLEKIFQCVNIVISHCCGGMTNGREENNKRV